MQIFKLTYALFDFHFQVALKLKLHFFFILFTTIYATMGFHRENKHMFTRVEK